MEKICASIFFISFYSAFGQDNFDSIILRNNVKEVRISDSKNKVVSLTKYDSLGKLIYRLWDDFTGQNSLKSSIPKSYDKIREYHYEYEFYK
ncbi:hypothetical protein [Moheibacter sediminis]|uniref:Uncharacterized protein n=1 Tax=Moheibacter sediminis TaxID=1434700 RepID=A0A1W2A942_9FLAO|nr:hypothetical protein [Moheibacter sediminis]SMC57187.1 hypothetical protein SAMN06296427_10434 [Moheibacter sediminis]